MVENLKVAYRRILALDAETPRVITFVRQVSAGRPMIVLDVGCGYGRTLKALKSAGIDGIGVEINPDIVAANRAAGLSCFTPKDFSGQSIQADLIIMSHVIEHFSPDDLLKFINEYLDLLKPEGHLLIATPLLTSRFFDDFDHVKPYQPLGLSMVFGAGQAQVQYYGNHRLELIDLWFRRSPLAINFARGLYVRSWATPFLRLLNLVCVLAFHVSFGFIGRASGWVGLFQRRIR